MSLSKTLYPLLSNGLIQEDRNLSQYDLKIIDCDINHENNKIKVSVKLHMSHNMRFPTMWYVRL